MKRTVTPPVLNLLLPFVTAVLVFFSSCNQQAQMERQRKVDEFNAYVQNKKDSVDAYLDRSWDDLNSEYERKKAELDKDTADMAEDMRVSYYKTVNDWESFKDGFKTKAEEKARLAKMDALRQTLVLDGIRPDYTDLPATRLVEQYEHFVNTVDAHKDEYTSDEWQIINVNYQALNGRKRELESSINAPDGAKIVKLQLQYTAIKAVNRPVAENP